jgi:elongation factor Ts
MSISAKDVKKLRDMTGAGMMDCKKALMEAAGDFEAAVEFLRKKGAKLEAKRADRHAKEGVVIAQVSDDQSRGVVLKLSCETDFVAKNEDFINLAKEFAKIAIDQFPADTDALKSIPFNGITIGEKVTEQVGRIGEKIELAAYDRIEAAQVIPYIHMGYKAGVVVGLSKKSEDFQTPGKDVAMQVAAMKPIAVDKDGVDPGIVEKEIEIGKEQARELGKPEAILEKIAMGKLNKFFKDNTLLNQAFVKDSSVTVGQYLKQQDSELTVIDFKHIQLG